MRDDTKQELERLERELLAQELEEDILDDVGMPELIQETEPAFEDPDFIHFPMEPMIYCNYSNDYGRDLKQFAESVGQEPEKKEDKLLVGLMITASGLCLGIIGVLIYWLVAYLRPW